VGDPQDGHASRSTRPRWLAAAAGVAVAGLVAALVTVLLPDSHPPAKPVVVPAARLIEPAVVTRTVPPPVPARTTIATVTGPVPFFASPGGPLAGTLPMGSWWLATKQLPVLARRPGWLRVRLPQRPNGLTGWIHADAAKLSTTVYGILVDLRTRRVELYRAGRMVARFPAGIGTPDDPTPTGQFYVMEIETSPGPGWGPFIVDTNAHSEAITSWEGSGDAFTAFHGPLGADAAIGTTGAAISHGCVRMHDADLARLAPVPLGAPVVIVD
jgi:lipoprotein-anchoring transpeptidase ErfK/SrfK